MNASRLSVCAAGPLYLVSTACSAADMATTFFQLGGSAGVLIGGLVGSGMTAGSIAGTLVGAAAGGVIGSSIGLFA